MTKRTKQAFSLVELSLSVVFLGTMILAIATLTTRIMKIYQKGLAIRNVNTLGREIIDDINKHVASSRKPTKLNPDCTSLNVPSGATDSMCAIQWQSLKAINKNGNRNLTAYGLNFVTNKAFYDITRNGEDVYPDDSGAAVKNAFQAAGVFCTEDYSYIWNTAPTIRALRDGAMNVNDMKITVGDRTPKLARVNKNICQGKLGYSNTTHALVFADEVVNQQSLVSGLGPDELTDIISANDGDSDLAIYDLRLVSASQDMLTNEVFYNFSMVLGTVDGGIDIMSTSDYCKTKNRRFVSNNQTADGAFLLTDSDAAGIQYCALNKFDFTVVQRGEASL